MRRILVFSLLLFMSLWITEQTMAQKTTGCNPKACGPEDTKTGEAKVITNLRDDLGQLKEQMINQKKYVFDTSILQSEIKKGKSDAESLLILALEVSHVENELRSQLGSAWTLSSTGKQLDNRAQQLAYLRAKVKDMRGLLEKQLQRG